MERPACNGKPGNFFSPAGELFIKNLFCGTRIGYGYPFTCLPDDSGLFFPAAVLLPILNP